MRIILPIAALGLCALSLPAGAEPPLLPPAVTCHVLLPQTALPHDPGHTISMIELTVPPDHLAHRHMHDTAEFLHVLSGHGFLNIDGLPDARLEPGAVVVVPPHTPHQEHNPGAEPLVYASTFIAAGPDHVVTVYLGEKDHPSGCPHKR